MLNRWEQVSRYNFLPFCSFFHSPLKPFSGKLDSGLFASDVTSASFSIGVSIWNISSCFYREKRRRGGAVKFSVNVKKGGEEKIGDTRDFLFHRVFRRVPAKEVEIRESWDRWKEGGVRNEEDETRRIFSNARIKDTCEQLPTFRATFAFPRDLCVKITRGIS